MSYLAKLKKLKEAKVDSAKSDKTKEMTPTYIKRCDRCGGTDWGAIGSDSKGEVWGCLTCHFAHPASCPECHGLNIVNDAVGNYCVDCKKCPGSEPVKRDQEQEPIYVDVQWAKNEKGWLSITNPLTGEVAEIRAKGLPDQERWLFSRLPERIGGKSYKPRADEEDRGYTADPDKEHEKIIEDYRFIGEVKMRDNPIASGKESSWRADGPPPLPDAQPPLPLPELSPAHKPATCPKCRAQRVKHLVADSMCMACGHKFETDYRP